MTDRIRDLISFWSGVALVVVAILAEQHFILLVRL
jgi:hypothetical protein